MRTSMFLAIAFSLAGQMAFAVPYRTQMHEVNVPVVPSAGSVTNAQVGALIYDQSTGQFNGLNASGSWVNFGGGANTSLSNLSSTAVNADIKPASNNTVHLGDQSGHQYASVNANFGYFDGGNIQIGHFFSGIPTVISPNIFNSTGSRGLALHDYAPGMSDAIRLASGDNVPIYLMTAGSFLATPNHIRSTTDPDFFGVSANVSATGNVGSTGSCSATVANPSDVTGQITITTDGTGIAAGAICDVNFAKAYGAAPFCQLTPANSTGAANTVQYYVTSSTSAMTINFVNAGTTASTYIYNYFCIEKN